MDITRFTKEGPANNEIEIIGVELAIRESNGVEHELEMFKTKHTLAFNNYYGSNGDQVRVTLHTDKGDITLISHMGLQPGTYVIRGW